MHMKKAIFLIIIVIIGILVITGCSNDKTDSSSINEKSSSYNDNNKNIDQDNNAVDDLQPPAFPEE